MPKEVCPHDGHTDNAAYLHDSHGDKWHYQQNSCVDGQCYRYWL